MLTDGFPTLIAAEITGVSPTTLDNWDRRGFLKPSAPAKARGISRMYSFRDLVAIRVANELRDAGISVSALKRVVKYLRGRKGLSPTDALAGSALVTDGLDVYEVEGDVTVSTLSRPGQRVVFVVPFAPLVSELQAKARLVAA